MSWWTTENCQWCNCTIEQTHGGRYKAFCGTVCRVAAHRAKRKLGKDDYAKFLRLAVTRAPQGNPASWWHQLYDNSCGWGWKAPDWKRLLHERKKLK